MGTGGESIVGDAPGATGSVQTSPFHLSSFPQIPPQRAIGALKTVGAVLSCKDGMKQFDSKTDMFVKEHSDIDAFCVAALTTVEKFIRGCKERDLTPSYDNFTVWLGHQA